MLATKLLVENPAAYDFMKFSLENAGDMAEAVGYVRLQDADYEKGLADSRSI